MALQIIFDDQYGNHHAAAYVRIETYIPSRDEAATVRVAPEVFKDQQARTDGQRPVYAYGLQVTEAAIAAQYQAADGLQSYAAIYRLLKTLELGEGQPDLREAKDV